MAAGAGRYAAGAGSIGSFTADKRRCFGGGGGWPLRGRRGDDIGFAAARRFCPGRAREGPQALSCFNRTRRRVRRVRGNFFRGELAPRRRSCFLADSPSAPFGRRRICVGVEVCRGSLLPRHLEIASYRERTDRRAACRPISENAKFAQVTSSLGRNVDCASARQRARRTSIHTCSYMSMASVMSWKNSQRAMTSSSGFMTAYTRASSSSRVSATAFMGVE